MQTIEITLHIADEAHELFIADLMDLDFSGFLEEENRLKAYIPLSRWNDTKREYVEQMLARSGYSPVLEEVRYEPRNWNALWEETIRPTRVGRFYIRPTWAHSEAVPEGCILLEIDPKLSFGTGYHESTRLCLRLLPDYVQRNMSVLDVGTGTGVLAIAAVKLGAASAVACDTDSWAQENCVENFYLNGVQDSADFRAGSLEVVPERDFDLILANIERNVLLDLMAGFAERISLDGHVILAGLLTHDRDTMLNATDRAGFYVVEEAAENEWWSVVLRRAGPGR